jgi:hypothetical protein
MIRANSSNPFDPSSIPLCLLQSVGVPGTLSFLSKIECTDIAAARAVLGSLPLVAADLIDFDLIPLAPYPGFARLFIA